MRMLLVAFHSFRAKIIAPTRWHALIQAVKTKCDNLVILLVYDENWSLSIVVLGPKG